MVGNEFNYDLERPNSIDISPEMAGECYVKVVREARLVAPDVLFSPGAVAPWNVDYDNLDWLRYQLRMLQEIERLGEIPDSLTIGVLVVCPNLIKA